jgi:uncharacterized protein (TIGR02145 family)
MAMARNKFAFLTAGLVLAMTFTLSCSGDDGDKDEGGGVNLSCPVSDVSENSVTCGGETYPTVVIGTQTWLAKNLNYAVKDSKCYGEGGEVIIDYDEDDNPITKTLSPAEVQDNCVKYGRLYSWPTAMTVCPSGWHIPSNADWDKLYRYADGTSGTSSPYDSPTAGKHLKAQSGWNPYSGIEKLDTWGFSALPGGRGYSDGSFDDVGDIGYWWSASELEVYSDIAYNRHMYYYHDHAYWKDLYKSDLQSVRCIKD